MKSSNNTEKTLDGKFGYFKALSEKQLQEKINSCEKSISDWLQIVNNIEPNIERTQIDVEKYKRLKCIEERVEAEITLEFKLNRKNRYLKYIDAEKEKMRAAYMALTEKQLSHAKQ